MSLRKYIDNGNRKHRQAFQSVISDVSIKYEKNRLRTDGITSKRPLKTSATRDTAMISSS